jgi:hypothetical protein
LLASHFTGQDEGALALLRSGGARKHATATVLAWFGGALPINSDGWDLETGPLTFVSASDSGARKVTRDSARRFARRAGER